jgi:serine/threonine protein kinase
MAGMRINLLSAERKNLNANRAWAASLAQAQAGKAAKLARDQVSLSANQRRVSRLALLLLSPLMLFGIVGMPSGENSPPPWTAEKKDLAAALLRQFKKKCFPNRSPWLRRIIPFFSQIIFPFGLLTLFIRPSLRRTELKVANKIKYQLGNLDFAKEIVKLLEGRVLNQIERERLFTLIGSESVELIRQAREEIAEARQLMRAAPPPVQDEIPSQPSKPPTVDEPVEPKKLPDHPQAPGEAEEEPVDKTRAVRYQRGEKITTAEHSYTIVGHLQPGGFSDVYRVKTSTGKLRAAKVISVKRNIIEKLPEFKDRSTLKNVIGNVLQRLEQEYRTARETKDRHFCRALDTNIYEVFPAITNSILFNANFTLVQAEDKEIIMINEFVAEKPGSPNSAPELTKDIKEGMQERRALNLFLPAMKALHYEWHVKGIAHRDLKPPNMLLPRDENGEEYIKYIDFGTVKDEGRSTELTEYGVPHTPDYRAPKSYEKKDAPPQKIDIYQLGLILIAALCKNPFKGMDKAEREKYLDGEKVLTIDGPGAPSEYQSIRSELRQALQRMVSSNPEENYATLLDAVHDIEVATGRIQRVHSVIDVTHEVAKVMNKVDKPSMIRSIDHNVLGSLLGLKYPLTPEEEKEADIDKMHTLLDLMDKYLELMRGDSALDTHKKDKIDRLQNSRDGLEKEIKRIKAIKEREVASSQSQPSVPDEFPVSAPKAEPKPEATAEFDIDKSNEVMAYLLQIQGDLFTKTLAQEGLQQMSANLQKIIEKYPEDPDILRLRPGIQDKIMEHIMRMTNREDQG